MGKAPSEHYWEKNQHNYPFQTSVDHFSEHDLDPRVVQQNVSFHFLRVPFSGKAYWGFMTEENLNQFKRLAKVQK